MRVNIHSPAYSQPTFSERDLRALSSEATISAAGRLIRNGSISERVAIADNGITARVSHDRLTFHPVVLNLQAQPHFHCTCDDITDDQPCAHTAGLLLAWLREPETFAMVSNGDDIYAELAQSLIGNVTPALVMATDAERGSPPHDDVRRAVQVYRQQLNQLPVATLREITQHLNLNATSPRKDALVRAIARHMGEPGAVEEIRKQISPSAQHLLTIFNLVDDGEGLPVQTLELYAQQLDGSPLTLAAERFLQELARWGLLVRTGSNFVLPELVRQQLGADYDFLPRVPAFLKPDDGAALGPFTLAQLALHLMLAAQTGSLTARAAPAPPSPRSHRHHPPAVEATWRKLSQDSLTALSESMGAPLPLIDYLAHLLSDLDLLHSTPGAVVRLNTTAFNHFLAQPLIDQTRQLLHATLTARAWMELDLASEMAGEDIVIQPGASDAAVRALQQFFLENRNFHFRLLKQVPPVYWIDFDRYLEMAWQLSAVGPAFAQRNPRRSRNNPEQQMHDLVVNAVFAGPWAWLGLVNLKYENGQLKAFSMTDLGDFLLGGRRHFRPPRQERRTQEPTLRFLDDGSVQLDPTYARPDLLDLLNLLSRPQLDEQSTLVYRMSASGAGRAFEAGWTPDTIAARLAVAATRPVPDALQAQLELWWQRYGSLHLYHDLALIELRDDYALAELMASTSLAEHQIFRFSNRLIAVAPGALDALMAEMSERGFMPKRAEGGHDG